MLSDIARRPAPQYFQYPALEWEEEEAIATAHGECFGIPDKPGMLITACFEEEAYLTGQKVHQSTWT